MKTRCDFVSNSSSSSFILANDPVFEYFHITKQDIVDALIDIYGKDRYYKYIKDREAYIKEHPDWYEDEKRYQNHGPFYVYDMSVEADRNEAHDRWDAVLAGWDATGCELNYKTGELQPKRYGNDFAEICDKVRDLYDISGLYDHKLDPDDTMFVRTAEKQKDGLYGYKVKVPEYVVTFINEARKFAGILDNRELLYKELSRFFIHYDDNELWSDPMQFPSKNDEDEETWDENDEDLAVRLGSGYFPDDGKNADKTEIIKRGIQSIKDHNDWSAKKNKERDESIYESEAYTDDRVFEVLYNKLVENGKIKANDEKFLLEAYGLEDRDSWRKNAKYNTDNGQDFSWKDLADSCLTFAGHEG